MPIEYEIKVDGDWLRTRVWGREDDLAQSQAYAAEVIEAAVAHGCTRIFCDERACTYALPTMDLFQMAQFITESAPHVWRAAIVVADHQMDDAKFFETVSVNRGLTLRVFTDTEAAKDWLCE